MEEKVRNKLLLILFTITSFSNASLFGIDLPKCDEVNDTLSEILANRTKETGIDLTMKGISSIKEVPDDNQKDVRTCYAMLQTPMYNKLEVLYSISPYENNQYYVQIEEANPIINSETLANATNEMNNKLGQDKLEAFELAKKYGDMQEACLSLNVAKNFFLDAKNEEQYVKVKELLKENCEH